jgi:hypothetical protein
MARKTRRRGKRGKKVRGTRRIGRIGRVRGRSRGGSRRYNNGGGLLPTLEELGSQVKNIGKELGDFGTEAYTKAYTKARELEASLTRPSVPM